LKKIIFILLSIIGGYLIYLFHFYIPSPITVKINFANDINSEDIDIYSTSFLYNKNKLTHDNFDVWKNKTGLCRNIKITTTKNIYNQISNIDLSIGSENYKIDSKNIETSTNIENPDEIILEITTSTIGKTNWFYTLGILNHRIQYKSLFRGIFDIYCLYLILFVLFKLFRFVRKKSITAYNYSESSSYSIIPVKHLEFYTILFLILPWIIFVLGYLKLQYSIVFTVFILSIMYKFYINSFINQKFMTKYSTEKILFLLLFVVLIIFFSGIGGLGFQTGDWEKHNFVLADLISHKWPVIYNTQLYSTTDVNSSSLVFYIAYYMFPALIGKISSWNVANYVLIFQSIVALFLTLSWVIYFVGKKRYIIIISLAFIFFSGADILGNYLNNIDIIFFDNVFHFEIYTDIQYSSFISQLFWVPHHAFSSWLTISLFIYYFQSTDNLFKLVLIFSISTLWSVYVATGLIPFIIAYLIINYKASVKVLKPNYLIIITSFLCLFISFFFYISKSKTIENTSLFIIKDFITFLLFYVEFTVIEWLLLFYLILRSEIFLQNKVSMLLFTSFIILLLCPILPFPSFYDFSARASIPSLFIINILLIKIIFDNQTLLKVRILICILLIIGTITSVNELGRSVKFWVNNTVHVPPVITEKSTLPLLTKPKYAKQYMGNENSFFFRYLCKSNDENFSK